MQYIGKDLPDLVTLVYWEARRAARVRIYWQGSSYRDLTANGSRGDRETTSHAY